MLFGKKNEPAQPVQPTTEFSRRAKKLSQWHGSNTVDSFLSSIKGIGHPEYPILNKQYSPSSRIPCTDLVPFISNRIIEGDDSSIKTVMRAVIEGNLGLGVGPEWIDDVVDKILSIKFQKYVSFLSASAISELKALFIVASKGGGGRQFLITEETPRLISWACIAHHPSWSPEVHSLARKANSWITKMAKDTPYWQEYEKFELKCLPTASFKNELRQIMLALSPAAKMQLLYIIEKGGGALPNLTSYQIRSLGINIQKTLKELIDSSLILPSDSTEAMESAHSKQELIELCENNSVVYRKSWNKEKLVSVIKETDLTLFGKIAQSKNLVSPNYERFPDLRNLLKIADEHQIYFKLLCFI